MIESDKAYSCNRSQKFKQQVCQHPNCKTILNIYNKGSYCFVHQKIQNAIRERKLK